MEPIKANTNDSSIQGGNVNEVQGPIQKLPPEILSVIFSQMNNLENQQLNSVSTLWNVEVLNAIKEQEFTLLDSFVTRLIENLELIGKNANYDGLNLKPEDIEILIAHYQEYKHSEAEREKQVEVVTLGLVNILKNTKVTQPFDLFKIKSSLISVKNEIINLLMGLDPDFIFILLKTFNNEKLPATWDLEVFPVDEQHKDEIFELVRYLQLAKSCPSSEDVNSVSRILFDLGYVDRAIEMAKNITDKEYQSESFEYISRELVRHFYFDKAVKVIIENPIANDSFIVRTIRDLANAGKVDLAITVCNSIKDAKKRASGLSHVTSIVLQKGDYEGAIKICALIEDDQLRSSAKNKIIQQLTNDEAYLKTHPDLLTALQKS